MSRLEAFYAARARYTALRMQLGSWTDWSDAPRKPALRWFNRETYLVPEWPMPEAPSPDGSLFALLDNREVAVRDADGNVRRLTSGACDDGGWDLETANASPWSPDGRWLFACAVDRSAAVKTARTRFASDGSVTVDWPRSQRSGTPIDIMRPLLLPVEGGAPVAIDLGDTTDHFIRLLGWKNDSQLVFFVRFTRLLNHADLFAADLSGKVRLVMKETAPTFLRNSTVIWAEPVGGWLLGDGRYLWLSSRDGWMGLYLGHTDDGGALTRLTDAGMVVHDVLRWDEGQVWFTASEDSARPYDRQLYRMGLHGGAIEQLTAGDGVHDILFSADGTRFLDNWSSVSAMPQTILRDWSGNPISDPKPPSAGAATAEEVTVLAADGVTTLHGVLLHPQGCEPGQRYPLVHWLYGGPQMASAPRRFGPRDDTQVLLYSLTAMGYGVFVIDARGTPGRSKAFADTVWRSFAPHVVADQVSALRQVVERNDWIDPQRIGAMGRSWGAHFTLRLMAAAPELYRAGVLVVPGLDPYGGLIYEPYLGLPQDEPEVYRAAEPWECVHELSPDARLLLMAGTLDSPQLWDAQRLSTLLVQADIAHHSLIFAEEEHMFFGDALRFHDRSILEFFDATLG